MPPASKWTRAACRRGTHDPVDQDRGERHSPATCRGARGSIAALTVTESLGVQGFNGDVIVLAGETHARTPVQITGCTPGAITADR